MKTGLIPRYAVVATHNRPQELERCLIALYPQCDLIIIIDNASEPPVAMSEIPTVRIVRDEEQPPNLSRLWNIGIDLAAHWAEQSKMPEWEVAIINDDAIVPTWWWSNISEWMRAQDAHAGSMHPGGYAVHGAHSQPTVFTRLTGWAFILRGESRMRFDERFRWWCGDDDISMQARRLGGLVSVTGDVPNTLANTTTRGALAEQAALDMQAFVDKWGVRPW